MLLEMVKVTVTDPPESLATMLWETGSHGGARTVATNAPALSVTTVDGEVARTVPSHFMVITPEAEYPYPVREIVVPTTPLVGDLDREFVTVKVALAEEIPSSADTVCGPRLLEGTAKARLKLPVLEVVPFPTRAPSNDTDTCLFAPKLSPFTVTEAPTLPLLGARVIV